LTRSLLGVVFDTAVERFRLVVDLPGLRALRDARAELDVLELDGARDIRSLRFVDADLPRRRSSPEDEEGRAPPARRARSKIVS
jgi:hypothetical protein